MIAVLHAGPEILSTVLRHSGLPPLAQLPSPESVLARNGQTEVVLIGPDGPDPVQVCRRLGSVDAAVVICVPPDCVSRVHDALRFTPLIPSDIRVVPLDDPQKLGEELTHATERARLRRHHQQQLAAANQKLATSTALPPVHVLDRLLEVAPIGVVITNSEGRITSWNRRSVDLFGDRTLAIGSLVEDLFDDSCKRDIRRLLTPGNPTGTSQLTCSGGESHYEVRSASFIGQNLEPGVLFVMLNITTRVRAERARDEAVQQAAHALRDSQEARALLDVIFESAPVGLGFWDRQLRYQRVNRALAEINGFTPAQHVGKTVAELLPDIDASVMAAFRRVVDTGEPLIAQEASGYTPAQPGVLRHWSVSYYPVRLGDETVGAGAVCEDISDRKRIEEQIARAFERERIAREQAEAAERRAAFMARAATMLASSLDYRSTLASVASLAVPDVADWAVVDMLDENGTLLRLSVAHVDPAAIRIAEETHDKYPPVHDQPLWRAIRTGQAELVPSISPGMLEAAAQSDEHLKLLRRLNPRSFIVVPIRIETRPIGCISLVMSDSGRIYGPADLRLAEELANRASVAIQNAQLYSEAEQRRVEAERAAGQLRRVNEELEQFAYLASHDLQEPLRTVASFAQLLERRYRTELGPDAQEYIGRLVEGARRMSHLIHDLLEYSRVTRDEEIRSGPVRLQSVTDACVDALRTAINESGATVTYDDLPVLPRATASQIHQVMLNLLSNAIKYRRTDVPPVIHVSATRIAEAWQVSVRDNGQGFEPVYRERIFGVFKRLHGRDVPGTGIGLALCRRIVERHGGRITAESVPGEGSVFSFTVPD